MVDVTGIMYLEIVWQQIVSDCCYLERYSVLYKKGFEIVCTLSKPFIVLLNT